MGGEMVAAVTMVDGSVVEAEALLAAVKMVATVVAGLPVAARQVGYSAVFVATEVLQVV